MPCSPLKTGLSLDLVLILTWDVFAVEELNVSRSTSLIRSIRVIRGAEGQFFVFS
jgi:hypothetical protein